MNKLHAHSSLAAQTNHSLTGLIDLKIRSMKGMGKSTASGIALALELPAKVTRFMPGKKRLQRLEFEILYLLRS
jgi:hypothetical protein